MPALTVTVSQLNRYLRAVIEEDRKLAGIFVKGEISGCTRHFRSGHLYFSLKDENSAIRAVMFRGHAEGLRFEPENGMAVLAQGNVGVYERDGVYQLYVTDLQPDGAGALAVAFEQVKARLAAEGLFDAARKKPLPALPRRIGVVTSESGAALQDIVNVLARRYPLATLVLSPAAVQGREAPAAIVRALRALDAHGNCDVIIVGRGGGSAEDLAAFNDEGVARAVAAAGTPVISAVGHETDYTICDMVADLRAPTPSAAAELATPSAERLAGQIAAARESLRRAGARLLADCRQRLDTAAARPALRSPRAWLVKNQERLDFLSGALYNKKNACLHSRGEAASRRAALLDSLSPLRVLERGYCAAAAEGRTVAAAAGTAPGMALAVRFHDGTAHTVVKAVELPEQTAREKGNSR